jgi:hypothetical protein
LQCCPVQKTGQCFFADEAAALTDETKNNTAPFLFDILVS